MQEPEFLDSITSQVDPAHINQTNGKTSDGGWKFTVTTVALPFLLISLFFCQLIASFFFVQDCSLLEFLQDQASPASASTDPRGFKRQEAIWELFTSECFYFLDQLMVLKEVNVSTKNAHKHTD